MGGVPGGIGGTGGLKGGVLRSDPFQIDLRDGGPILRLHRPDCDLFHILFPTPGGDLHAPAVCFPAISSTCGEGTPVFPKNRGDAVGLPGCPGRGWRSRQGFDKPFGCDTIKAKRAGNVVLTAFPAFSVTNLLLVQCSSAVLQCSCGCIRVHPFPLIYAP